MSEFSTSIRVGNDVYLALHYARLILNELAFSDMDKQKVLVTVSELTRNVLDHAQANGVFSCNAEEGGNAIRIIVQDTGSGIENLEAILNGAQPTARRGLGLGLAGAKRMMDSFWITTSKEGTKIVCIKRKGTSRRTK